MLTISNYHYIRDDFTTKYQSIFGVTPIVFKKQLLLLKNKSDFISSCDLITNGKEILQSKENYFLITFDDGLKEQYQLALPILDELKIPAILFANSKNFENKKVSTVHKIHLLRSILSSSKFFSELKHINKLLNLTELDVLKAEKTYIYDTKENAALKYLLNFKIDFTNQEQIISTIFEKYFDENQVLESLYMTENEIIELSAKGFLGSHTHNHYPIGLLNENEMEFELNHSKLFFENLTNSKIEMVAYPYGSPEACTNQTAEIAKKVGYKFGFTTTRGTNSIDANHLLLNRFDCNDLPGGKNYKV